MLVLAAIYVLTTAPLIWGETRPPLARGNRPAPHRAPRPSAA